MALPPPVPQTEGPRAPVANKAPVETTLHGQRRVDDYFWMRNKKSPEVIAYLQAENAYAAAMTQGTEALQKTIHGELLGRMKEDDTTPPYLADGYS